MSSKAEQDTFGASVLLADLIKYRPTTKEAPSKNVKVQAHWDGYQGSCVEVQRLEREVFLRDATGHNDAVFAELTTTREREAYA